MKIVCVSDTHGYHGRLEVPAGDLLIHAGDVSMSGKPEEIEAFDSWLGTLPHRHKLLVAGNHDWLFQREPAEARRRITHAAYLEDSGLRIEGLRLWGSPWQPWFLNWAFNLPRGPALKAKWDLIPSDTDILITHAPPHGIGDRLLKVFPRAISLAMGQGSHVGCRDLRAAVTRLEPKLHVFGHIHEGYGQASYGSTTFVNASNCDKAYRLTNPPIVVEL